jgi:hypothetical protein
MWVDGTVCNMGFEGGGVKFLDSLNNLCSDVLRNFASHKFSFLSHSAVCSR